MFNKESGEIANLKRALLECKRKHEIGARLSNAAVKRSYHVCESFALSPSVARNLEARVGIEPTYKGFADLSLTTWVPRPSQ